MHPRTEKTLRELAMRPANLHPVEPQPYLELKFPGSGAFMRQ